MRTKAIIGIVLLGLTAWVGSFYWQNLRGAGTAFGPVSQKKESQATPATAVNTTGLPITIPDGFSVSIFAKDVPDARVLAWDPKGNLLVSSPATGKVFRISKDGSTSIVADKLNNPHGLAFKEGKLYIAETNAVVVYDYDTKATNRKKIIDLPGGGNHFSRTIGFGPDGKLYIAIGSSCNVCIEKDPHRAAIWVASADGSDFRLFAGGLRNAVFFTWKGSEMWATLMGRDLIGDDIPPETVVIVKDGKNYGWPYCYGQRVWDKTFDRSQKAEDFCKTVEPPVIEYQAHSAPLGLAFIPPSWGNEYAGDLLIAFHGSWNRTVPTGYKIVRFTLDEKGKYVGAEDFVSGWLQGKNALGRPVDLLFNDKGELFISDDKAGVVYRVTKT